VYDRVALGLELVRALQELHYDEGFHDFTAT
jgi:hypothetical protein